MGVWLSRKSAVLLIDFTSRCRTLWAQTSQLQRPAKGFCLAGKLLSKTKNINCFQASGEVQSPSDATKHFLFGFIRWALVVWCDSHSCCHAKTFWIRITGSVHLTLKASVWFSLRHTSFLMMLHHAGIVKISSFLPHYAVGLATETGKLF